MPSSGASTRPRLMTRMRTSCACIPDRGVTIVLIQTCYGIIQVGDRDCTFTCIGGSAPKSRCTTGPTMEEHFHPHPKPVLTNMQVHKYIWWTGGLCVHPRHEEGASCLPRIICHVTSRVCVQWMECNAKFVNITSGKATPVGLGLQRRGSLQCDVPRYDSCNTDDHHMSHSNAIPVYSTCTVPLTPVHSCM